MWNELRFRQRLTRKVEKVMAGRKAWEPSTEFRGEDRKEESRNPETFDSQPKPPQLSRTI